jgi:hypothetical protein
MSHTLPHGTGKCATFCGGMPLSAARGDLPFPDELRACKGNLTPGVTMAPWREIYERSGEE